MNSPKDYVAIHAWGKELQSFQYYIDNEQARAARENAPLDAIYERNGKWRTVSELTPDHPFRKTYERALAESAKKEFIASLTKGKDGV